MVYHVIMIGIVGNEKAEDSGLENSLLFLCGFLLIILITMVLCDIVKTRSSQQESTYSYASQIARKCGGQFVKLGYLLTPDRWLPRSKNHALLFVLNNINRSLLNF